MLASYVKGHKHGLLCLFRDGVPWLVQEWDKDKQIGEFVIFWPDSGNPPITLPALVGNVNLATAVEGLVARQALSDLERTIDEGENDVKQGIAEWYKRLTNNRTLIRDFPAYPACRGSSLAASKDATKRDRWRRAAASSVANRQDSIKRIAQMSDANDAAIQNMWQLALQRSRL